MIRKSVKCGVCGKVTEYTLRVNFTVYCPKCKNMIHAECEYGYGPVTPYYFLVGNDEIARVDDIEPPHYILYLDGKEIPLEKGYFDAIKEADGILSEKLGLTGFTSERRKNGK